MMRRLMMLSLLAIAAPAVAEEPAPSLPKAVKTLKVTQPAPTETTLYKVEDDGTVRIDWPAVEAAAASKSDRLAQPVAQMMLAIRDGTWKPAK